MQKWEMTWTWIKFESWGIDEGMKKRFIEKDSKAYSWGHVEEFGKKGWELVSVTPYQNQGTTIYFMYTFKRPIEE